MSSNFSTTQSGAPVIDDANSSSLGRDGAIDVLDPTASGAHRVMVVIIDPGLIPGGGVGCFDPTQQSQGGEIGYHHVHGLHGDFR